MAMQGANPPHEVNVIIEIRQMDGPIKYELDKEQGLLVVDRIMTTTMSYPANYGFIPGTLGDDGDPLDVLLVSEPIMPGASIAARPIGVLVMEDEGGMDQKILALPTAKIDPMQAHIQSLADIAPAKLESIKHFFEHYKDLEAGKWVKVESWQEADVAKELIEKAILAYLAE